MLRPVGFGRRDFCSSPSRRMRGCPSRWGRSDDGDIRKPICAQSRSAPTLRLPDCLPAFRARRRAAPSMVSRWRSRNRRNLSDSISFCVRALCSFEMPQAKVHNLNTKIATPLFNARGTIAAALLVSAVLFAIGVALRRSFAGIGLSGELEQDWAQLLFLAAFAFPPVARKTLALTAAQRVSGTRNLTYAFAAAYAAFLLTTALQGALAGGLAPLST